MPNFGEILSQNPFGMPQEIKETWFCSLQKELTNYHYDRCLPYKRIIDRLALKPSNDCNLESLPFLPVRLFKSVDLKSTNDQDILRVLTSSGTSGNRPSRIHLDRKAILLQSRVLKHIFSDIFPKSSNTTMFVVEKPMHISHKDNVSASVAAIRGFSQFSKNVVAILNDNGEPNLHLIEDYISNNPETPFVIFGFTSPVWFQLIKFIEKNHQNLKSNMGILIHGGGWKKMEDQSVNKSKFNMLAKTMLGINSVHNYYGMVEQTGSVFVECEHGFFHPSIFSEVIVRNSDLQPAKNGEPGLIQVMTLLAESYPGHNLLTDDIGVIEGTDYCRCGRRGKFFSVLGRAPGVELRGCSDAK